MKTTTAAAAILALFACATPAAAQPEARTDQVRVVYAEPTDAKHLPIRQEMQDRGLLETAGAILSSFRLPRQLRGGSERLRRPGSRLVRL